MKKYIKILLSLMLIGAFVLLAPVASAKTENKDDISDTLFGDINEDGVRNSYDARILLRCSVGQESLSDSILSLGDYDKNGEITADDARYALRVAVGLENVSCILNGHSLSPFVISPTCTENGYKTMKCTECDYTDGSKTDEVKAKGHSLIEETKKASCTEDGEKTVRCEKCSYISEKTITEKAYGHSYGIWQFSESCRTRTCRTCSHKDISDSTKVIYLTFDDGPGAYTERLLSYLREYDVKATFFVTNQMPKYRYVLPMIVNDGHAIGVHTLTHQWSVYQSKDSYLRDFNAMHQIILDDTGVNTKIFRFPGGTNNTISRNYSRGIMASAASHMTNSGYIYYDWNVDCGDTLGYSSSQIASRVINGINGRQYSIVLMHDIKYNTVEAVKTIIEYGLANGYVFEIIDESTPRVQFTPVN